MGTGTAPTHDRRPLGPIGQLRPLVLGLLAVGLVLTALGTGQGFFFRPDQPPARVRFTLPGAGGTAPGRGRGMAGVGGRDLAQFPPVVEGVLQALVLVVVAAVAVAVVVSVVRGLLGVRRLLLAGSKGGRRSSAYDPGEGTSEDATEPLRRRLVRSLDVGLPAVESAPEPPEAVIACYLGMEQALRDSGTSRAPAETQAELLSRVLVEHAVPAGAAAQLTDLFLVARFSRAPVDDTMRADALRALTRVRTALQGP